MYALDTGNENNFDIRLVNGDVASEGRVEVFYGGQWGTICRQALSQFLTESK